MTMPEEEESTGRARVLHHSERLASIEARIDHLETSRGEAIKMHKEAMAGLKQTNDRLQSVERRLFLVAGGAAGAGGIVGPWVHALLGG